MFAASKTGAPVTAKDPQFKYVTMLLHGDGTNGAQNNTFLDSSTNNFTITRNGNTTQGTFTPYGSNWSNYFDGVGDRLSSPASTAIDLSTADFTIECWVYPTSFSSTKAIIVYQNGDASNTNYGYWLTIKTTGVVRFENFSGSSQVGFDASPAISLNTWNHIAVTRTGTSATTYINGVGTTGTVSATFNAPVAAILNIGDNYGVVFGSSNPYSGYISNLRIVKGTRVYTANFTPPSVPLTAITNTSLLTCQSNRFIDNSTNNFTITVNGDTSVQRFSPFSPTTAYSTSVIGGSGYFDGSGDYLSVANTAALGFGTGDFTIEFSTYMTAAKSAADSGYIFDLRFGSGNTCYMWLEDNTAYTVAINGVASSGTAPSTYLRQWVNWSIVRASGTVKVYINGVQNISFASSGSIGNSGITVGSRFGATEFFPGYITDFRVVKGTAVYTTTYTPPTAPLTAITNTSLLLSYTNAGIFDNAMMNDLETVGNAQISTSVKKYGTGSLAFDGTGDYLYAPSSPNTSFGTGDFTIEFWMNSNNVSGASQLGMFQMSDTVGGLKASYLSQLCINQGQTASSSALNGAIVANINNSYVGSTTAVITTGTWYHIALVRNSGTVNLYVNGTSVGSASITSAINGPYMVVGGYYSSSFLYNGYIDDLRITKGYARYTANFSVPTAAFPNN